jgi:hypothetical protein
MYGIMYYGTVFFLSVKLYSPVRGGITALPTTVCLVPASIIVGTIITRLSHFRWALWSGWLLITLGHGLTIAWNLDTPTLSWVFTLMVVGIGHGFVLNAQNFATQAICLPHDEAAAAAMYSFLRAFGMALGVGLGSSIFQNVMKTKLAEYGLPTSIASNAEAYVQVLHQMPDSAQKTAILNSYAYGLRGVYGFYCAIAGVAGLSTLFIKHFSMDKELTTDHTLGDNKILRMLQHNRAGSGQPTRSAALDTTKGDGLELEDLSPAHLEGIRKEREQKRRERMRWSDYWNAHYI